jgi:hypothetical protein
MKKLLITGIDLSDNVFEQKFEIRQGIEDCLLLQIVYKDLEGDREDVDTIIPLRTNEMKALGRALVFAAEYVEELYKE